MTRPGSKVSAFAIAMWLDGACVSVDMHANAGVSFASPFFPRMGYYFPERIRNIRITFQMSPNCHFDSLNLVRNSNRIRIHINMYVMIRFGQLKERNSSVLDLFLELPTTRPGSKVGTIHWPCVATGGCGLETSICPLIILFRGYGCFLTAICGRSCPQKLKWEVA